MAKYRGDTPLQLFSQMNTSSFSSNAVTNSKFWYEVRKKVRIKELLEKVDPFVILFQSIAGE